MSRRRGGGGLMLAGAFALALAYSAHAHADVPGLCEHRGQYHADQHHMTREADSRWHVEHGERPTCGLDKDHHIDEHDDNHDVNVPHRDKPGFGCKHFHCG